MKNKINKIKNKGLLLGAILIFLSVFPFSSVFGANVFNPSQADHPLRIGNETQSQGTQNWQTSLSGVNAGDSLKFSVYFHNAGSIAAQNTNVRIQLSPIGSNTSFVATSTISATGFSNYTTTATMGLTSSQSIQFGNTATLYTNYNGSSYQVTTIPVTVSGNVVTYNLGTINPGYTPNDGYIIFNAQVSTVLPNPPTVSAGPNKTITSGQSTTLNGTASHPDGLVMTYQWSCNGGSLSNSTILQPIFYAPNVLATQTYSCTLTARDTNNNTSSSVTYITVNPVAQQNPPTVSAGPNKTITSGQSTTLNGTASHPDGLAMTYQWSCNGGSLSNSTILQPIFYAPNVLTTQTYSCTLTARDTNNNTSSSVTYITVNPVAQQNPPTVSAGPNKTITSGQSTTLNGTASHPDGLAMTYQWSCTGGSLSNSTILQPTFYAPNVLATQTYSCTLTARDTNNNTSSSITYITVNPVAKSNVFNPSQADHPLRIGNDTQSQGTQSWQTSLSGVNAGDLLKFSVYFHNAGSIAAQNTNVRIQLSPIGSNTSFVATSTISATGFSNYTTTATMGLTSSQSIQFGNTATLYTNYNGSSYQVTTIPVTVSGNVVTYNLGTINPGYTPNDGYIIFNAQVSTVLPNPPTVSAGLNKTITSGQSTTLNGTASHPDGLAMTYQWSCNGGSLSNSTILQPIFYAPNVLATQTYSCTLTARDTNNNTSSSVTYITVNPVAQQNPPTVSAGLNKTITSGQSTTLNGTASHPDGLAMTYQWSCNGGSLSNSTILQPIFYAPNVLATQTYSCTLTARDTNNNTSSSVTYITVNPVAQQNPPTVSAGLNKTITSGQSTTLNGTASHPDGLAMTYQWSCNGGSLSNSTILQPIFYAPNVLATQTYSCTLTARDTNNNTSSSVTYITVNPVAQQNPPTVSAGLNKTITSGQSTTLNGTASHPDGLAMTYQWSCNGGSLSNSTILQPTFYAPNVLATQTYSCTLTARDTNNNTSSSVTYITVNPVAQQNPPTVSAGPNKTITSGQSTTLNGTASHPDGLAMTYQWSCNGGSLSNSTILQPIFYAPNVLATQTYSCTLTARDTNNNTSSSVTYITVNPVAQQNPPTVSAGLNKTITSGQSTTLNGTASHPDGLAMTYQWSCNGGSLSNSTILQPIFYAPNVLATQTYSCTLTARDTNNNTSSSVTYITVNPVAQQNPPTVSAGLNKTITSGQSTTLNGTASHPDGLAMTYQWSCNGGSLSNSTILQPIFYAPNVLATQTYSCTLTARDTNNNTSSSVTYITVNPVAQQNPPTVSAGLNKTITSGQSTTLNGTASHPDGLAMTYQWSCNGGSLSNSTILQPIFYAPNVLATQTYSCTLTARDTNNNTSSSVTYITVNPGIITPSPAI